MAVALLADGTIVKAVDHWNPLATLANANEANLAAEITNRSTAVGAINTRLGSNIAAGGISDLPSWKTTIDNRTTDGATGNTALGARTTTLETRTTDASTGNTALGARVTTLEGASAAVGAWTPVTTFLNSWANRTPTSTYIPLQVRTEPGSTVRIAGNLNKAAGGANGEQVCTLPGTTFRPLKEQFVPFTTSAAVTAWLRVDTAGAVYIYSTATTAAVLNINGTYPLNVS